MPKPNQVMTTSSKMMKDDDDDENNDNYDALFRQQRDRTTNSERQSAHRLVDSTSPHLSHGMTRFWGCRPFVIVVIS